MNDKLTAELHASKDLGTLNKIKEIVRLTAEGHTRNDIARQLHIDPRMIWRLRQTPEFKEEWAKITEEVREQVTQDFTARVIKAGERTEQLMLQNDNLRVALSAAIDIQDRAGFKPRQEVDLSHVVRIDVNDIRGFAEAARHIGAGRAPRMVEAEWKEVPVLPDKVHPETQQIDLPFTSGDV